MNHPDSPNIKAGSAFLELSRGLMLKHRQVPDKHPPRILIVEDSSDDRLIYEREFRGTDFLVTFSISAAAAIALINSGATFDLILVDINLPVEKGTKVLERLDEIKTKYLVVVASGALPAEYLKSFRAVSKPVTSEKLYDILEKEEAMRSDFSGSPPTA